MIFLGCGGIGFSLGNDYILRIKHLERIKKFFLLLEGEIKYSNSGIFEALTKLSKQTSGFLTDFLGKVAEDIADNQSLKDAWNISVTQILKNRSKLFDSDMIIIKEFGESLGITDRETQIKNIENTILQIDSVIQELKKYKNEKCKIFKTLGIVVGAFITILLL
jgi:stage III sporulation protein AB